MAKERLESYSLEVMETPSFRLDVHDQKCVLNLLHDRQGFLQGLEPDPPEDPAVYTSPKLLFSFVN